VVTLIGMDTGPFRRHQGAQALRAHPAAGHPESALINFNNQYLGKSVTDNIEVGPRAPRKT
jgi:NosR/NirI family nitrous oxide reductase transcriptional regulator